MSSLQILYGWLPRLRNLRPRTSQYISKNRIALLSTSKSEVRWTSFHIWFAFAVHLLVGSQSRTPLRPEYADTVSDGRVERERTHVRDFGKQHARTVHPGAVILNLAADFRRGSKAEFDGLFLITKNILPDIFVMFPCSKIKINAQLSLLEDFHSIRFEL